VEENNRYILTLEAENKKLRDVLMKILNMEILKDQANQYCDDITVQKFLSNYLINNRIKNKTDLKIAMGQEPNREKRVNYKKLYKLVEENCPTHCKELENVEAVIRGFVECHVEGYKCFTPLNI
tara:strand:- start:5 stop:376 length:372 start_codon:yes stop_codon:yes gene_type:complete